MDDDRRDEHTIDISEVEDEPIRIEAYCRKPLLRIFSKPRAWGSRIDASFVEGYYNGARALAQGVISGSMSKDVEGLAALFLFRHYLELHLKYLTFHVRWLREWNTNALDEEVEDVGKSHNLLSLWQRLRSECDSRVPKEILSSFDIESVEHCVNEFHSVDPSPGTRFRYPAEKLQVGGSRKESLDVSFDALLRTMDQVYSVLDWLDEYLLNQHGENRDYQEILDSY